MPGTGIAAAGAVRSRDGLTNRVSRVHEYGIDQQEEQSTMTISLTSAAADHIREYLAGNGAGQAMRLGVKTTGCSGLSYVVEAAGEAGPEDLVFEQQGVKVIVDKKNMIYLDGTEIDYRREGLNAGFYFTNPNEKATCGCGESFTV